MIRILLRTSLSLCAVGLAITGLAGFYWQTSDAVTLRHFPARLESALPYDVDVARVGRLVGPVRRLEHTGHPEQAADLLSAAQREFDLLSWQAFLSLNWPATPSGEPDASKLITDPHGQPVWSFWRPSQTIFLPDGKEPAPWNAPAAGRAARDNSFALLKTKAAWRQQASPEDNFEAFSGPLVDQNGKWVRYEALVNQPEFEYIRSNKLYSLDGQIAFSQKEDHNEVALPVNAGVAKHGSIEIKLAWKELGANDDASRFLTKEVRIKVSEAGPTQYRLIKAGLVGMHIAMRTESSPEWIWSTFEQIDNVRQNPIEHGGMSHANFTNPALTSVPVNFLQAKNALPDPTTGLPTSWFESLTTTPVQVVRVAVPTQPGLNPLDQRLSSDVAVLNGEAQAVLKKAGSVFQYYELVGTQWPVHKNAPAFTAGQASAPESIAHKTPGDVLPIFLVNTTMETYFQHGLQKAGPLEEDDRLTDNTLIDSTMVTGTESCVGCHYSAGICVGYKKNLDGTPFLSNGLRVPIFGDRENGGKDANANFSWMLQLEASSPNLSPPSATPKTHRSGIKPNVQP
jgi:hypothetical protein